MTNPGNITAAGGLMQDIVTEVLMSPQFRRGIENVISDTMGHRINSTTSSTTCASSLNESVPVSTVGPSRDVDLTATAFVSNQNLPNVNSTTNHSHTFNRDQSSAPTLRLELHRLFPSIRPKTSALSNVLQGSKKQKRPKHKNAYSFFSKDLVLLDGPDCKKVLKGKKKVAAHQKGNIIFAAKFQKEWSGDKVKQHIYELFSQRLPTDAKFEIMMPVSGELVLPALPVGESLDGYLLNKIFTHQSVYIRPTESLSSSHNEDVSLIEMSSDDGLVFPPEENKTVPISVIEDCLSGNSEDDLPDLTSQNQNNNSVLPETHLSHCGGEIQHDNPSLPSAGWQTLSLLTAEEQLEADTEVAMRNSLAELQEGTLNNEGNMTVEKILGHIQEQIDESESTSFNVDRLNILDGCKRAIRRKSFTPYKKILAVFTDSEGVSEGAIDGGGPSREMWVLVNRALQDSNLFEGSENSKNLALNNDSLNNNLYFEAGQLMALSVIHGGNGPKYFSDTLYSCLTKGIKNCIPPTIDEVADYDIKHHLQCIENSTTLEELQKAMNLSADYLALSGCSFSVQSIESKGQIVHDAVKFFVLYRTGPALDQLKEGLNTFRLLQYIQRYPELFRDIFCYPTKPLTSKHLQNLFQIRFSEAGSNRRLQENMLTGFWRDYLIDCSEAEAEVSLAELLLFATGSDDIPPQGFPVVPSIEFQIDSDSKYPQANTCSCILKLPVVHQDYDSFRSNMDFGIKNGMCFGFA